MLLETERLRIQPLTEAQLRLYAKNDGSLEKELNLPYFPKEIHPDLADTLENYFLRLVSQHPKRYYFYTLWTMIHKESLAMVGDLCFKGEPDEEGQVEIGYGTHPDFQQQGFMKEAVVSIIDWSYTQPAIHYLLAETEAGNLASEKVLLHNQFHRTSQTIDNSWWKRKVMGAVHYDPAKNYAQIKNPLL